MRPESAGVFPVICVRYVCEGGVSPRVHAYRGRGHVCVTRQLYGRGMCGGVFASGREKGVRGVLCGAGCISSGVRGVCCGCGSGAGGVGVTGRCAVL